MSKARILVVEDEAIVAEHLRTGLVDLGYEVCSTVASSTDAIRASQELRPDLVLMDIVLRDGTDGIVAASFISSSLDIPVVYVTSHTDESTLNRAQSAHPYGYLMKPFRETDLRCSIEMALSMHSLYRELKESREWLSVTLNSIGDGVIATDTQGRVKFMNAVAESLTGWKQREAGGLPLREVYSASDVQLEHHEQDASKRIMFRLRGAGFFEQTSMLVARDGPRLIVESTTAPIRDTQRNVIGEVLVFRNVTETRSAVAQLWLMSQAVEQSSEGIAVVDLDGTVMFLNKAFAEMHGYTPEEVIGKSLLVFHSSEQIPQVRQANRLVMENGTFSGEIWHARTDGTVFPGLMHNSVLRDTDGNPFGLIGTLRDISDIKRTQQELQRSHEALETYSSSLETKVEQRTTDLEKSRMELKRYSVSLEKANEALKMVIESIEEQKKDAERTISQNLSLTVQPIIDQLKSQEVSETVSFLLDSLEVSLKNLFSSFRFDIAQDARLLTPKEIRVCQMIRSGLSSKQIAKIMGITANTVLVHRKNIRKKLQLEGTKTNLESVLKERRV